MMIQNILSYLLPAKWLHKQVPNRCILPFYHGIGEAESLPFIKHLYQPRDLQQFKEDINYIRKYYTPVSIDDLNNQRKKFSKPVFHLSFDDGLRSILPALEWLYEEGVSATLFINSAFIDNKEMFYRYKASLLIHEATKDASKLPIFATYLDCKAKRSIVRQKILDLGNSLALEELADAIGFSFQEYLKNEQPYLTSDDLKNLSAKGFTLGGHSIDHPYFSGLEWGEQLRQIRESSLFANQFSKEENRYFSFPFTDYGVSKRVFTLIEKKNTATLTFGCAGIKKDIYSFHYQRFGMESGLASAKRLLRKETAAYLLKKMLNKHIVKHD